VIGSDLIVTIVCRSFLCARSREKNQLIVGPQMRASKVLRETYGERFMTDHGMRIFVESIAFVVLLHRNKKVISTINGSKNQCAVSGLSRGVAKDKIFL
jgi:hypothetical protein